MINKVYRSTSRRTSRGNYRTDTHSIVALRSTPFSEIIEISSENLLYKLSIKSLHQGSTHRPVRSANGAIWCVIFGVSLVLVRYVPTFQKTKFPHHSVGGPTGSDAWIPGLHLILFNFGRMSIGQF